MLNYGGYACEMSAKVLIMSNGDESEQCELYSNDLVDELVDNGFSKRNINVVYDYDYNYDYDLSHPNVVREKARGFSNYDIVIFDGIEGEPYKFEWEAVASDQIAESPIFVDADEGTIMKIGDHDMFSSGHEVSGDGLYVPGQEYKLLKTKLFERQNAINSAGGRDKLREVMAGMQAGEAAKGGAIPVMKKG
ncbi:MAG: hypothetical protein LBM38_02425 [Clostridiales bacterium]|jgi:hypothetical protein|nr:hypothetical protein [Clostridiales bacterium]